MNTRERRGFYSAIRIIMMIRKAEMWNFCRALVAVRQVVSIASDINYFALATVQKYTGAVSTDILPVYKPRKMRFLLYKMICT